MKFKNDSQRKAVMSQYSTGGTSPKPIKPTGLKLSNQDKRKLIGDKVIVTDSNGEVFSGVIDKVNSNNTYNVKTKIKTINYVAPASIQKEVDKYYKPTSLNIKNLNPTKTKRLKSLNKSELKKLSKSKTIDSDGDGVVNSKDCEPFNPKKQGLLHDIQMKVLKKQEEKLENQRLRLTKETEEQKLLLEKKLAVSNARDSLDKARMKKKQVLVDEINREKNKIKELQQANAQAKKEIFNKSPTGKLVNASKNTINKTREYMNKPSTKKSVKKFFNKVNRFLN